MDTAAELTFADGVYRFWLPLPQVIELERRCGQRGDDGKLHPKSVVTIFDGLNDSLGLQDDNLVWIGGGAIHPSEVNEVLRLALIGGNSGPDGEVGPVRAGELVALYGYPARPLIEVAGLAWRVLRAAILGIEVKKKDVTGEADDKPTKRSKKGP